MAFATTTAVQAQTSLAEAYRDYWYTGVSVNQWQVKADLTGANEHDVTGQVSNDQTAEWPVIVNNFNWVVAENCMKCEVIHPKEGVYDFTLADKALSHLALPVCSVVPLRRGWQTRLT